MDSQRLAAGVGIVRRALVAMYAPGANNAVVKQNEAIMQDFKKSLDSDAAVAASRLLLQPILQGQPIQDYEALYGLQLVSERILQVPPWLNHSEQVRIGLRQLAVELVMHTAPARYSHMVQEKVANLLVSLAIREWPQHWPRFLEELLEGTLPPQMVCVVLRLLSEEVHEFGGSIASTRKAELGTVMSTNVDKMLPFITTAMEKFVSSNDTAGMRTAVAVIEAFMTWVPTDSLFNMRIPTACIRLLNYPQFAASALSALHAMLKRKDKGDTGAHVGFRKEVFPSLVNYTIANLKSLQSLSYSPPMGVIPDSLQAFQHCTYQQSAASMLDINSEEHEYTVKFVHMLAKLGSVAFIPAYVLPDGSKDALNQVEQQTATAYIDIMLSSIASPSLQVRIAGIGFFTSVFAALHRALARHIRDSIMNVAVGPATSQVPGPRNTTAGQMIILMEGLKTPFVRELFLNLVKRFVNTGSLALIRWPKDPLLEAYAEEDYAGDTRVLSEQWNAFKTRAAQNISLATKLEPMSIMKAILDRLVDLLGKANAISWPQSTPSENGSGAPQLASGKLPFVAGYVTLEDSARSWMFGNFNPSDSKVMVAALDGAVLASEAVLAMLTSIDFFSANPQAQAPVENLFKTILNLSQPNMQAAKVSSLRMFIPLYKNSKEALQMCLRCLVEIIEQSKKSTLCFRACTSLAAICRRLHRSKSTTLKEFLNPMREFALRVQGDVTYAPVERNLILDSAVAVTLLAGDVAEQAPVVESLINPLMGVLDSSGMTRSVGSPQTLFEFLENAPEKEIALACLHTMESAMTQIVRANRNKTVGVSAITTSLTQSIAPKAVTFASLLVSSLHAMYNPSMFPITDKKRKSVLLPTSRELASLLNLSDGPSQAVWLNPVSGSGNDFEEGDPENEAKSALERADDLLNRMGIQVPDPEFGTLRENLKKMRLHAYELLRAAILSGVSMSAVHLQQLLKAVCAHMRNIEPIHVHYLLSRVIRPLLSHPVVQANEEFLGLVNSSELPAFFKLVRNMVAQVNSGEGGTVSSTLFALEVARDHGRKMVAKSAAEVLSVIYPRDVKKGDEFVPTVFKHANLGSALIELWDELCCPNVGVMDNASARLALALVARALEFAPVSAKGLYSGKLMKCLETAFRTDGMGSDSPYDMALGAIMAFMRKWPEESSSVVMGMIGNLPGEFQASVGEKLKELMDATNSAASKKTARSKLRQIVRQLAKKAGTSVRKEVVVENLPTKPVVRKARGANRDDDMTLPDSTLDSLFGGGEPL